MEGLSGSVAAAGVRVIGSVLSDGWCWELGLGCWVIGAGG